MTNEQPLEQTLTEICADILPETAQIFDCQIQPVGKDFRISLTLDNLAEVAGSFSSEELAGFSQDIFRRLDSTPWGEKVSLELSTPGVERELRGPNDYARFEGQLVRIEYRHVPAKSDDGAKKPTEGLFTLGSPTDEGAHVHRYKRKGQKKKPKGPEEFVIEWDDIMRAHLYLDF